MTLQKHMRSPWATGTIYYHVRDTRRLCAASHKQQRPSRVSASASPPPSSTPLTPARQHSVGLPTHVGAVGARAGACGRPPASLLRLRRPLSVSSFGRGRAGRLAWRSGWETAGWVGCDAALQLGPGEEKRGIVEGEGIVMAPCKPVPSRGAGAESRWVGAEAPPLHYLLYTTQAAGGNDWAAWPAFSPGSDGRRQAARARDSLPLLFLFIVVDTGKDHHNTA